jgi:hypothetical protein
MSSAAAVASRAEAPPAPNLDDVKARQQGAWSSGDYAVVGTTLQIVGEQLCEALDLRSGQSVLDVAAGNGNASLAAGVRSPALWGTRPRITEMFKPHAASIAAEQRNFVFRYRSREHWLEVFRTYYGPLLKTFAALDPAGRVALEGDVIALIGRFNRSGDGTMVVPSEYLEIVIARR